MISCLLCYHREEAFFYLPFLHLLISYDQAAFLSPSSQRKRVKKAYDSSSLAARRSYTAQRKQFAVKSLVTDSCHSRKVMVQVKLRFLAPSAGIAAVAKG